MFRVCFSILDESEIIGMIEHFIVCEFCPKARAIQTLKYKVEHQKTSCKHHAAPNFIEGP